MFKNVHSKFIKIYNRQKIREKHQNLLKVILQKKKMRKINENVANFTVVLGDLPSTPVDKGKLKPIILQGKLAARN